MAVPRDGASDRLEPGCAAFSTEGASENRYIIMAFAAIHRIQIGTSGAPDRRDSHVMV